MWRGKVYQMRWCGIVSNDKVHHGIVHLVWQLYGTYSMLKGYNMLWKGVLLWWYGIAWNDMTHLLVGQNTFQRHLHHKELYNLASRQMSIWCML